MSDSGYVMQVVTYEEHFEICSLVGTLSGQAGHLHVVLGREAQRQT